MTRQLEVRLDHARVGTLSEGEDLWVFEYEQSWAASADGFDLSPALPRSQRRHADGGTRRRGRP